MVWGKPWYLSQRRTGDMASARRVLPCRDLASRTGSGVILIGAPSTAAGYPTAPNLCLSNNEPLMRWLVDNFASRFASFRGAAGLPAMTYHAADSFATTAMGAASIKSRSAAASSLLRSAGTRFRHHSRLTFRRQCRRRGCIKCTACLWRQRLFHCSKWRAATRHGSPARPP